MDDEPGQNETKLNCINKPQKRAGNDFLELMENRNGGQETA